ncbi:MAG: HNH endonuclease signature motif containing protein [Marmoricola sp.]
MATKYTREILQDAVSASESIAGVLRHLGIIQSGGSHAHISRTIKKLGMSTTHFKGQGWNRGRTHPPPPPEHYLRLLDPGSPRINGARLRRSLIAIGRPYICDACHIDGVWMGREITLHVDHIDGNYLDCRAENLRFLCPNCHSQTWTHAGRNKGRAAG